MWYKSQSLKSTWLFCDVIFMNISVVLLQINDLRPHKVEHFLQNTQTKPKHFCNRNFWHAPTSEINLL
jgi:hypothetical protein